MNRRNSILNTSSDQPQSTANSTSTQDLPLTDFNSSCTAKDYDAAAAALSRLSVLTQHSDSLHGTSPQLNCDSTYETTIISVCPSPKRSSDYFDESQDESNLKRMRRESLQNAAYVDMSLALGQLSASPGRVTATETHDKLIGLGFETLPLQSPSSTISFDNEVLEGCQSTVTVASPLSEYFDSSKTNLTASESAFRCRSRSRSAPIYPSRRWSDLSCTKQQRQWKHLSNQRHLGCQEPLIRRNKEKDALHVPLPPITQQTLRELELSEIFKNAQLRHDIVHDPNLQFRPNTDGERGAKKRQESNRYWQSVVRELDDVQNMPVPDLQNTRLSHMFLEMKHILLSLVPTAEKAQVEASFDHALFMQTLNHGLFSPSSFAGYLSSLMKRHCAPMRDDAIDETVTRLEQATDSIHFAQALRATFDILETMKLDVANHQLRTLRGYLLNTSVEFEKSWFNRKFDSGVYIRESAITWYKSHCPATCIDSLDHRRIFVNGFMSFLVRDKLPQFPATFTFDQGRIQAIHKDLRESVCLNIVLLLAKQMMKDLREEDMALLKAELWALLITERPSGTDKWTASIAHIALYIAAKAAKTPFSGLPDSASINFATAWLTTHLSASSSIFVMVRSRLVTMLSSLAYDDLTATKVNGHRCLPATNWGVLESTKAEILSVSARMCAIVSYHWTVHGANYIQWSR